MGGNGAASLLGSDPLQSAGQDVAGTIGATGAMGAGQRLTGAAGTPAEGLSLSVNGGVLGARGNLTFSRGYGDQLGRLIDGFLGTEGAVQNRMNGLTESIRGSDRQQEAVQRRLEMIERRYRAQFTSLDATLGGLNSTSAFLQRFNSQSK
jgi:flagellar hook-associated protein 2